MDLHFYIFLIWLVSLVAHLHTKFKRGEEVWMALWYLWLFAVPIYFSGLSVMYVFGGGM